MLSTGRIALSPYYIIRMNSSNSSTACLTWAFAIMLLASLILPAHILARQHIHTPKADALFFSEKETILTARWNEPFGYETIKSNHAPLGPYMGNGDVGVVCHTSANSQTLCISKVDFVTDGWEDWAGYGPAALPIGGIKMVIESPLDDRHFSYTMNQRKAELEMTSGTRQPVNMISWMTMDDNIIVTELTAKEPVNVLLEVFADSMSDRYHTSAHVQDEIGQVTRRSYTKDVRWISRAAISSRILGANASTQCRSNHKTQTRFELTPKKTVYILTYVSGGGMDDNAHTGKALSRLKELSAKEVAHLKQAQQRWWYEMWTRSYVETNDSLLNRQYLTSIYLLASAYSTHSPACGGMYGVWNMDDRMMYHGDIHLNYNSQAGFYSLFSANRPELATPYYDFIEKLIPEGRRRAREEMEQVHPSWKSRSCQGILFPVGALGIGVFYNYYWNQTMNAPFNIPLFSWYYEYTGDTDFLRDKAYPFIRECGDFYEDYLQKEKDGDSYLYTITTGAHEGSWDKNPPSDLAFVELTFRLLLRYSHILGVDQEHQSLWQDIVSHLPSYPVVMPTRTPNEGLPVFAKNAKGWDLPNHAIQMHPVYPCELLNLNSSTQLLNTARNTIYYYGVSQRGFTECMNELGLSAFVMGARIGLSPEVLIENLKAIIRKTGVNFLITDGHHCMEKTAIVETINSMMLQSVDNIIQVFPCWPHKAASFKRLRAKGAFLLSADYDGDSVTSLTLYSEKGNTCHIKNPWPGHKIVVTTNTHKQQETGMNNDICTFSTTCGTTYHIEPRI